jgi:hypothetical protein
VLAVGTGTLLLRRGPQPAVPFRSGETVVLVAPTAGPPAGDTVRFVWRAVPTAVRYRVDVLSATGDSVLALIAPDTVALAPAGSLHPGGTYVWTVVAVFADGSQAVSEPGRFTVVQR